MTDRTEVTAAGHRRMPVVVLISDILSGVDSWVWRLQAAFEGHPRYDLQVLVCNARAKANPLAAGFASNARELSRFLKASAPCIVLPNYVWAALRIASRQALRDPRLHLVAYCHSDSLEEYYNPLQWYEPIISHFIAVSGTCERGLIERVPGRRDDVTMLPYGIRLGEPRTGRRADEPLRILYSGRLARQQKRILDLEPMARHLLDRGVDFRLTIAGDGPDRAELQRVLAPLGDRIELRGSVPYQEMRSIYRQHDVLVLVSQYEGTSNSLLEAMAEGLVPVVTRTGSGVDILEDRADSRLVEVGAMDAMARAIEDLARDREALDRAGARARAKAAQHTIAGNVRRLETVFDRVLQHPPRSWPPGRPAYPRVPVYDGVFVPRPLRRLRQWIRRRLDIG